jgi:hypothetical protein
MNKNYRKNFINGLITVCAITSFLYLLTLIPNIMLGYRIIIGIISIISTIIFPVLFFEFRYYVKSKKRKQKKIDTFIEKTNLTNNT